MNFFVFLDMICKCSRRQHEHFTQTNTTRFLRYADIYFCNAIKNVGKFNFYWQIIMRGQNFTYADENMCVDRKLCRFSETLFFFFFATFILAFAYTMCVGKNFQYLPTQKTWTNTENFYPHTVDRNKSLPTQLATTKGNV